MLPPNITASPIRLFAALTRAVRDEPMDDAVRARAFELLTRLGDQVFLPGFDAALDAFTAFARRDTRLGAAVQPFVPALAALRQGVARPVEPVR